MNPSLLLVLNSGPGRPDWNMALDEALLVTAGGRGAALLRLYGWTEPAATFGYFQRLADVEPRTRLRPLLRRPTGGGIVPHDRDWTYSLTVPPSHPWHRLRALDSYRTIHDWVIRAFTAIGVPAELAACCRKEIPGACFEGYEQFDVLWQGRKVAGAAQRRNALGLLIQGSVQPPPSASREAWESAMIASAPGAFFDSTQPYGPDESVENTARSLVRAKYANPDHLRLR